jgi:hypothetical protein
MASAAATNMDAQLLLERLQPALQRADDAGSDARRMPVHPHYRAERLKPERMRETAKQLVAAVVVDNRFADHGAKPGHAVSEPSWDTPAMQGQISGSRVTGHLQIPAVVEVEART